MPNVFKEFEVDDLENRRRAPAHLECLGVGEVDEGHREVDLPRDEIGHQTFGQQDPVHLVLRESEQFEASAHRARDPHRATVVRSRWSGRPDPELSVLARVERPQCAPTIERVALGYGIHQIQRLVEVAILVDELKPTIVR